jgi:hypothetical protein
MKDTLMIRSSIVCKWLFVLSLLWYCGTPVSLLSQELPDYYIYHGQRKYFQFDEENIAVKYRKTLPKQNQISHLRSFGVNAGSSQSLGFNNWHVTGLQTAIHGADRINQELHKLSGSTSVEFVSPVIKGERDKPIIITQDVLVKFKPEYHSQVKIVLQTLFPEFSILNDHFGNMSGAYQLRSKSNNGFDVLASANRLVEEGYAEWSEPDMIISGEHEVTPNDPYYSQLWGIHNTGQFGGVAGYDMKGDLAWNITMGDTSVKVMVIDCGVQQNHPDIHQLPGLDFTGQGGGGGPVNSCDNHGTAVAGCIAGKINNSIGIAGIAPNCYVISARTLVANSTCDNTYTSQISWTVNALAYAGANGIRITNFSNQFFGTTSSALEAEYLYTHDSLNVVHFAAAGNGNTGVYYPASIPVVNAVGAMNSKGVRASFSNYGSALDFMAPGDSIWVTDRTGSNGYSSGDYYLYSGTSFASPYAAGVAALILSQFPNLTAAQVEARMRSTSLDLGTPGFDNYYGWGFLNAYNAVRTSNCTINQAANISVSADPGQCGAIVSYSQPTTTGNCAPVTCTPPSGSFFNVGTTLVSCTDTLGDLMTFTVTVTGGNITAGVLRDNFNRANGNLVGSNKWATIVNSPNSGSLAITSNQMKATNSAGNYNFGGLAWDTLMTGGTEASVTLTQKSGVTSYSGLFIYARMNNKDYNTGTGYRLRYLEQSGADLIEIDRVTGGYANTVALASVNFEVNVGDVITFRILCDNQSMSALVNGSQVLSIKDPTYTPNQWYFGVRSCVFPTPILFDNFTVSSQPSLTAPPSAPVLASPLNAAVNQPATLTLTWNASSGAATYRCQVATDSLFTGLVVNDSTLTTTSRQVANLSGNIKYYWRVNASNVGGTSAYSSVWSFTTIISAPSSPILASPANGTLNQATTITLAWNASTGASTYRCQAAIDSLFTGIILDDSTTTSTSRQISSLLNGKKYFWRVNAKNAGGTSTYSTVWNFSTVPLPPSQPVLASPANGSSNQPSTFSLSWSPSAGAATYTCQVATDSLFSGIVLNDSTVTSTSRQVSGLANGTLYYWRVNAKNSGGTSVYSTVWNFTTAPPTPSAPVLAAPASGSTNLPVTVTLTWNSSSGASTYRCQAATDSLFGSLVVNDSTITTLSRQIGPLSGGNTYYWRVSASNAGGTSPYSSIWSFTTLPAPPSTPILSSPANASSNQATTVTLRWNATAGAGTYECQVSLDSLFSGIVLDDSAITSPSRQLSGLATSTGYYWRVNAKNSGGTSAYSTTWNFTTIPALPTPPVLLSPSNSSLNQPTAITLTWNASPGAATYRCQLAADSLFGTLIVNDSTLTTPSRQIGPLSGGSTYYWKIKATNAGGTSAYSAVWNFATAVLPPSTPILASPINNAINQTTTPTLNWSASPGAASYRIQVATDSLFTNLILDDSTLTSLSRIVNNLGNSTKFYWHVTAKNSGGTSAYSSTWSFTTIPPAPSAPILASPASGSTNQATTLTLSWNASAGAATYRCQLATDSLFSILIVNDSTLTTPSRQVGPLSGNTLYFWRVNASNAGGTSAYSTIWNFTTQQLPPAAPSPASPANNSVNQPTTIILTWNSSAGASSYILQAAADSNFTQLVAVDTTSSTSQIIGSLLNSSVYYWHICAQNGSGTSSYSVTWKFTTAAPAPAAPSLQSPQNFAACQATTLTFSWLASNGATSYRFQLASDTSFTNRVVDDSTVTTTSRTVASLSGNTSYSWRVCAKNAGGSGQFSARRSFATFPVSLLRDDFNRADGVLAGSNKWALIQNQPSGGSMSIVSNGIQPASSAGNYNFGGVVWDSLNTAGSEVSFTLLQKSGNFSYSSFFIYAKMSNKDYNTGTGYRLRYFEQNGTDVFEIHRVPPGYANSVTIASASKELNVNDVVTFRVLCDNKTLVGLVNGVQIISAVDSTYMPSQWYFAVRACVFPTPCRLDNFKMSPVEVLPAKAAPAQFQLQAIELPSRYSLEQNYPNPFNPTTKLRYSLPQASHVRLVIYNVLGQVVKTLIDEFQNGGFKEIEWNASSAASGVYLYRIDAAGVDDGNKGFTQIRKMVMIR